MNPKQIKKISKFMSLVLRHKPEVIGLQLDSEGWADVEDLMSRLRTKGLKVDRPTLNEVVADNDKKRFAFDESGTRIRASQGHSLKVDLKFTPEQPPEQLYHGTARRFVDSIMQKGLIPGTRQHVHLSQEHATAVNVGGRHGKPVVLIVQSGLMAEAGFEFYLSANNVWLTDHVPVEYISTSAVQTNATV